MLASIARLILAAGLIWVAVVMDHTPTATVGSNSLNSIKSAFETSLGFNQNPNSSVTTSSDSLQNTTMNWSGYDATGGTYSAISGAWTVPEASGSNPGSADATWIGIGGVSSNDLIQTGTQNEVGADGQVQTTAFYELLPDNETPITTMPVVAGDQISASIGQQSDGLWQIKMTDLTSGQSFSTEVQYASSESSAEWVEEDPSDGVSQVPLDNFGTVNFTSAGATEDGSSRDLSGLGAQVMNMDNQEGQALATVSGISTGSAFSVTRTSASADTVAPGGYGWTRHGHGITRGNFNQNAPSGGTGGGGWYRRNGWWR